MFSANTAQVSSDKLYVDDVFSTYLYTGNGSTQTINNGIDLAGKGGLVWVKDRTNAYAHLLFDTERGATKSLSSNSTNTQNTNAAYLTSFGSSGFSLGSDFDVNRSGDAYTSWTFRKAPKFFDVVTYTGNGVAGRQIPHNLGVAPGMIIVKHLGAESYWGVYHRSIGAINYLRLNTPDPVVNESPVWGGTEPTSSSFTVGLTSIANQSGSQYVAYLFAHDPSEDGIIQCGSVVTTSDGSTNNGSVNLGWEPQYVLVKNASSTIGWYIQDNMRGMTERTSGGTKGLEANSTATEWGFSTFGITSTGFEWKGGMGSGTFIYLAIRRPNKPPTTGMQVFNPIAVNTGSASGFTFAGQLFDHDFVLGANRTQPGYAKYWAHSRLTGSNRHITTAFTIPETDFSTYLDCPFDRSRTFYIKETTSNGSFCYEVGSAYSYLLFKRAPGFMDVVCYTGTGVVRTVTHNLGVVPTLTIIKRRDATSDWRVTTNFTGFQYLNDPASFAPNAEFWGYGTPTSTTIPLGIHASINASGGTYVAYLFASLPGISKVGSYTGNGTTQTINCGFTTGARFILIKRTDSTSDWYVWDSARGIIAANDPHLSLNTTATEVTTNDSVDPDNSGFIVNQLAATNINVTSATYIYLAIA